MHQNYNISISKPAECGFDIRVWVETDRSGRTACPSCIQDGKLKQKNLSINRSTGAYHCWRGCSPDQIRDALGAPKRSSFINSSQTCANSTHHSPPKTTRTISLIQVQQSQQRLLNPSTPAQINAWEWLAAKGFTPEMLAYYRLGFECWWCIPDNTKPNIRQEYGAIALHIPSSEPDQFYQKLRIAPWLHESDRPNSLLKWSQFGVPATIFYTYRPNRAIATWFCEGEWDAMRLGWIAQQLQASIAVCCSTAGCGTVSSQAQLDELPGEVTLFFDRNDVPTKSGIIPGDAGAQKLALALDGRGKIAQVPMPNSCTVSGWDVSNALDAGFTWADFKMAADEAIAPTASDLEAHQASKRSVRDRILEILQRDEVQSERDLALMNLARDTPYSCREIEKLAQSLTAEIELEFDRADAVRKLQDLLLTRQTRLDLRRYLEPWLAEALIQTAAAMPTAPEFLFTTLLPAAASRIGTAAQVVIKPSAKYTQPMVFWSAIVAHSGSMKTPSQRVILDPLLTLERDAYEDYQAELDKYKAAVDAKKFGKDRSADDAPSGRSPTRKRYLTKDSTLETLQRIHAENPRGLLYYRDELAGSIKVRNQYRGGHGADEEAELDQWTGSAVIVDRAEKSICLPQSAISRTGAIQWEVLAKLMGDHHDVNGAWSRWLFCAANAPPRYLQLLQNEEDSGLSEALTYLYSELEQIPQQDYLLSVDAKRLFETWQHQLVDAQRSEEAIGLQRVYPKIESYTARLALWLHIVNAVLRGEQPTQLISGETLEKAIELAAYYLWQHRLIQTHNAPDAGLAALGLKIQKFAERVGAVSASRLKSGIRALRKTAVHQIRQLMQLLATSGYGSVKGEGAEMIYVPAPGDQQLQLDLSNPSSFDEVDVSDASLTAASKGESHVEQRLQPSVETIDTIDAAERDVHVCRDSKTTRCSTPTVSATITPSYENERPEPHSGQPDETSGSAATFQRNQPVNVWFRDLWVPATYIRPIEQLIFSQRTRKLEDTHHVLLQDTTQNPRLIRIATPDLRCWSVP